VQKGVSSVKRVAGTVLVGLGSFVSAFCAWFAVCELVPAYVKMRQTGDGAAFGLGVMMLLWWFLPASAAVLLMAVPFAFAPVAYVLDAEGVMIARRLVRPVFLPYLQVKNVALRRFPGPPFAVVRLGSYPPWGFFGYFGRFKVERLGWIRVYATSWENEMVVLETEREPYFLSPAEPQRFYEALRARLDGTVVQQCCSATPDGAGRR
jgi:hypothetical protein